MTELEVAQVVPERLTYKHTMHMLNMTRYKVMFTSWHMLGRKLQARAVV